ncbi:MAG: MMPL family transporter, partial [Minisyncoccia bacterium]
GFLVVALFLLLWYRLPGLIAVLSLCIYVSIILALFKLLPVTLTAAGIAGFIISMGIAVDANILIFERVKEELRSGRTINDAVSAGFSRAWFSIRDSNISSIITAVILFWFGTPLIKGFALTLGMGVLVSMLSAITITKIFLSGVNFIGESRVSRFLFSSGISSGISK